VPNKSRGDLPAFSRSAVATDTAHCWLCRSAPAIAILQSASLPHRFLCCDASGNPIFSRARVYALKSTDMYAGRNTTPRVVNVGRDPQTGLPADSLTPARAVGLPAKRHRLLSSGRELRRNERRAQPRRTLVQQHRLRDACDRLHPGRDPGRMCAVVPARKSERQADTATARGCRRRESWALSLLPELGRGSDWACRASLQLFLSHRLPRHSLHADLRPAAIKIGP